MSPRSTSSRPFLDAADAARARPPAWRTASSTRCESLDALALPDAGFDLVWSEGALYSVGFDARCARCAGCCGAAAALVATELTWLVDLPASRRRATSGARPIRRCATRDANRARDRGRRLRARRADFALPDVRLVERLLRRSSSRASPRCARARDAGDARGAGRARRRAGRDRSVPRAARAAYGYVFFVERRLRRRGVTARRPRQRHAPATSGDGVPTQVSQSWCTARVAPTCSRRARRGRVGVVLGRHVDEHHVVELEALGLLDLGHLDARREGEVLALDAAQRRQLAARRAPRSRARSTRATASAPRPRRAARRARARAARRPGRRRRRRDR